MPDFKAGFKERLKAVARRAGSAEALARKAGISRRTLENWLSGSTLPKADALEKIATSTGVNLNWLVTGEGEPQGIQVPEIMMVPVLDVRAAAGAGALNFQERAIEMLPMNRRFLRSIGAQPESVRIIWAHGESMEPTIQHGDMLMLDVSQRDPRQGGIFVIATNDGVRVKRLLVDLQNEKVIARSDNPKLGEEEKIPPDDLNVVGRVLWIMRRAR